MQFRRMFRMSRERFYNLCQNIITNVGESKFKSESYIIAFLKGQDRMFIAHGKTSGGYISGEQRW